MAPLLKNFLLIGESGIGKSTVIRQVLERFKLNAGGFTTREIKSGKTAKGVQLLTLDGQQAVLAHINKKSTYKVGKFGVDLKVLSDIAVPALKTALEKDHLVVIDEIGKMECYSMEFRDMVIRCLDADKPVLGSMQTFASPFINIINNREDIVMITVTRSNREQLVDNITELLKRVVDITQPVRKSRRR